MMKNPLYIRQQAGFGEWLRILNFDHTSQRDMPKLLGEFLAFLESHGCNSLSQIQESHLQNYLHELSDQQGKTGGGTLSLNYRRKHLQVIRKFARYLCESGQESFAVKTRIKGETANVKGVLTRKEIAKLYATTAESPLGLRDRALLALYYGCGLRKSEGLSLNTEDILLEKELVLVRKGKGYKARYVPLTGSNKTELEHYLNYGRPYLGCGGRESALLLNIHGKRLKTAFERIWKLRSASGIKKAIGPHTLRHSIATHLLQSGMKLEQIQLFLGHSSLESTQIYTQIVDEL
ncbi:tyrosine-type recombinase/integrase [Pedobacter cryoconitis]|uniref:tyrosine-type recombinase/integrase n=1 Tax=Pedobacter cryoconitis TaxID=188932 RepID=UPI0016124E65|nr:tyrosine-type recombinase/integrase [Pedobacter cryoconitis]MBB5649190.1 site-specific recombinase XerD [Pedobacter cryoconitis]